MRIGSYESIEPITGPNGDPLGRPDLLDPLGDIIIESVQDVLKILFEPIQKAVGSAASAVVGTILSTPTPNAIFGPPSNGVWPDLYSYYWEGIIPLALFLYGVSIGLVIFLEATSHLFGSYYKSKLIKRAFTGLLGILSWWWLAGLSLRFANSLTAYLAPDLSSISMFETASFGAMGVLGLVLTISVDLVLILLIAVVYAARYLVLYLFVIGMPILIVLWIPGVGPFSLLSGFAKRLAGFYVPFLLMTLPVALLFRLGDILGNSFGLDAQGFAAWLLALAIPFVALLAPIVFVWQAGAIFVVADRTAGRFSRHTASDRVQTVQETGARTRHGAGNFNRGVHGEPAMRPDGQYVIDSGSSRAHALGSRVHDVSTRVERVVEQRRGGGGSGGVAPPAAAPADADEFETLRNRTTTDSTPPASEEREDERPPRYFD